MINKMKLISALANLKGKRLIDLSILAFLSYIVRNYREVSEETKSKIVHEILYSIFLKNKWISLDETKEKIILDQFTDYCKIAKKVTDNHTTKDGQLIVSMRLEILLRNELTNLAIKRIFSIF